MRDRRKLHASTNKNLEHFALEPTLRRLIAVALDGDTVTYGDIKALLEDKGSFSTIFTTRIGHVAGYLMHRIEAVEPSAPLINVLVVNQTDRKPSKGAGDFMARHFNVPKLGQQGAKERFPNLWDEYFSKAAAEVYAYSPAQWASIYERLFEKPLRLNQMEKERDDRMEGRENDGLQYNKRRYGRGGEGPEHKALREWTTNNPGLIRKSFANARTDTEVDLYSGDRVDAVYWCEDRTVVLEVKSRISDDVDLRRGVYQCIKYRAVKAAMDVREKALVDAFLVTEKEVSGEIKDLLKLHKIKHFIAPMDRD